VLRNPCWPIATTVIVALAMAVLVMPAEREEHSVPRIFIIAYVVYLFNP